MDSSRNRKSKRNQLRGEEDGGPELTKEEMKVARHLRLNCPNKQGSFKSVKVDFFIANRLVDALMDSKWGPGLDLSRKASNPMFTSRQACVNFMQRLMNNQMFYRAQKIYKDQQQPASTNVADESSVATATSAADTATTSNTPNLRKRAKNNKLEVNNGEQQQQQTPKASSSSSTTPSPKPSTSSSVAKQDNQKRKFKLDEHQEQKFVDANEPFIWIYDPTSTKTYIIGGLLILGAIGICLFPLWPPQVREGVYYVSVAGASFLGAILGLAGLKYVLFALVWIVTFGKVHFWLFPNLTEDVGFIESFIPVYKCNCGSSIEDSANSSSSKKSGKSASSSSSSTTTSATVAEGSSEETASNIVTNDLSKSTLNINKVDSPMAQSMRKKSLTSSVNVNDDDDFELVNDDELVKE